MLAGLFLLTAGFSVPTGPATRFAPAAATSHRASTAAVSMKLPELYVYDHCPFCVRVRLALGVKGIK
jgi:hypothetical protein